MQKLTDYDSQVLLRSVTDRTMTSAPLKLNKDIDPSLWTPSTPQIIDLSFKVPSFLQAGIYEVIFNLPDPDAKLANKPDYSIVFANANVVDRTTRYNVLNEVTLV